jgi:Piwi domain
VLGILWDFVCCRSSVAGIADGLDVLVGISTHMSVHLPKTQLRHTAGKPLYRAIKQASDSELGVPSQCIIARKAGIGEREPRGQAQYIANVAMKVNSKLGGHNVELAGESFGKLSLPEFAKKPFMAMGKRALRTCLCCGR